MTLVLRSEVAQSARPGPRTKLHDPGKAIKKLHLAYIMSRYKKVKLLSTMCATRGIMKILLAQPCISGVNIMS